MRIAVTMHFRVPYQCAGSEVFMHRLVKVLQAAGHEVAQFVSDCPQAPGFEVYDGVPCYSVGNLDRLSQMVVDFKPDLTLTHHDRAQQTILLSNHLGIPSVFVMHSNFQTNRLALSVDPTLVVFNTQWVADEWGKSVRNHSMVLHPPVLQGQCSRPTGNKITLINLNEHKGGAHFYQLADMLPQYEFLGVVGAHGQQLIRRDQPNVEIQRHTANMCDDVWAKTKILLMPSIYESYGMTGLEACCQGIPVLANPTPGLQESLGIAGWFIPRDDIQRYAEVIDLLMTNDSEYQLWSEGTTQRASELQTEKELAEFVAQVEALVQGA